MRLAFWPDPEVFKDRVFSYELLAERLRELAFLNEGLEITLIDRGTPQPRRDVFCYSEGIADCIRSRVSQLETVHPQILHFRDECKVGRAKLRQAFQVALQWTTRGYPNLLSYVNDLSTLGGGRHETGLRRALTATLNKFIRVVGVGSGKVAGEDCCQGLVAVLSVALEEPLYGSATYDRLRNPEVEAFIYSSVSRQFGQFLSRYPEDGDAICCRILAARDARLATQKKR
jgi:DNA gyrase subunit B